MVSLYFHVEVSCWKLFSGSKNVATTRSLCIVRTVENRSLLSLRLMRKIIDQEYSSSIRQRDMDSLANFTPSRRIREKKELYITMYDRFIVRLASRNGRSYSHCLMIPLFAETWLMKISHGGRLLKNVF